MSRKIRTFSWVSPKCEIRETGKYGKGVFAKEAIRKDELVAISGGYIFKLQEFKRLPERLKYLTFQVEEDFFMGIKKEAEMEDNWRFNHSCDPNIGYRAQLSLVAMRKIRGEELTFDYATTLFQANGMKPWKMQCFCGSENCRKVITDSDWKIPELQERYKGYFQYFLQEKIDKLKIKKRK